MEGLPAVTRNSNSIHQGGSCKFRSLSTIPLQPFDQLRKWLGRGSPSSLLNG